MSNGGEEDKPDTLNPSSIDSESESESDVEEDHRLETLEKELAENSSNYDAHVQEHVTIMTYSLNMFSVQNRGQFTGGTRNSSEKTFERFRTRVKRV